MHTSHNAIAVPLGDLLEVDKDPKNPWVTFPCVVGDRMTSPAKETDLYGQPIRLWLDRFENVVLAKRLPSTIFRDLDLCLLARNNAAPSLGFSGHSARQHLQRT